jgi:hypothetical protein
MTNKPKALGTAAEVAVCDFLRRAGYQPERIALAGHLDRGDVHYRGRAGNLIVVSVKGGKMAEQASPEQIAKWVREVQQQAERAGTSDLHGAYVVTKRAGFGVLRAELWRAHYGTARGFVWSTDLATMAQVAG